MIAPLLLFVYAAGVGAFGARWLSASRWVERAPRLAVLTWQALACSVLASVVLAGLALALPAGPLTGDLASLLHTCVALLRKQYLTPGGAMASTAGLLAAAGTIARFSYSLSVSFLRARAGRARQRERLGLVARCDEQLDAFVLDHPGYAAYCVPGRRGQVVLTSGTVAALEAGELVAVLAHERAHLRGRHHLVVQSMSALRLAFPFVPVFRTGAQEVARLTEMVADDAAVGRSDRMMLATALVRLAEAATPVGTLGAGGSTTFSRVRRLAEPSPRLPLGARLTAAGAIGLLALLPVALVAAPALAVIAADYCPVPLHI